MWDCARPVFALERLRQIAPEHLVFDPIKPGPGGSVSLLLTTLELIERLAALIPPPRRRRRRRRRRHRYYDPRKSLWDGVLAPNAPLRAAMTAVAVAKVEALLPAAMTEAMPAPEPGATVQKQNSLSFPDSGAGLRVRPARRPVATAKTTLRACRGTTRA